MYVYVWRTQDGTPFYVGMGSTVRRANPRNLAHRNAACREIVQQLGADNVVVELHSAPTEEAAKEKERVLIQRFGRIKDGTGSLANIADGGEFHRTSLKTREKIKALWEDPLHREKAITPRVGKKRGLAESTRTALRAKLEANPAMRGWGERNADPEFTAKRIAGIGRPEVQAERAKKMTDPIALAQRKERLRATMASPEYKAKRAAYDTPEYRAKLSVAKAEYWRKKKLG